MNTLQHFFQLLVNVMKRYWDYVQGKAFYIAISAIAGIIVPYTTFHWLSIFLFVTYFAYLLFRFSLPHFLHCLLVFFFFFAQFLVIDHTNKTNLPDTTNTIVATVVGELDINGDKLSAIVKTSSNEKVLLTYILKTEEEKIRFSDNYQFDMVCTYTGKLKEPEVARNPNAFNYKHYLYTQKIHWIFEAQNIQNCSVKDTWSFKKSLLHVRQNGIEHIDTYFKGSNAGIVQALIYGERGDISDEVVDSYQSLGLIHLLAISGLHVSLMTGMFYFLCIRVGITRETSGTVLICVLPLYAILAGGSPSVVRSVIMSILVLASILWWKKINILDVISLTCIGMLIVNPYFVVNIGFQLSFVVSFALIVSSGFIFRQYKHAFTSLFVVSYLSQLSSLPILLFHFYEFSFVSLPLNMVYVPLYSFVILPLALLTVFFLLFLEPLGELLVSILSVLIETVNQIAVFVSTWSLAEVTLGKPHLVIVILYVISIFCYLYQWEKQKRILNWSLLAPFVIFIFHYCSPYLDPYGEVTVLDVGQGDAIYVELPFRKAVYLIDTGGTIQFEKEQWRERRSQYSTGKDIILPFLASKGVRKIDRLIITHGDQDHIGGAKELLEKMKVIKIMLGKTNKYSVLERELGKVAKGFGVDIEVAKRGGSWKEGETSFLVLSPKGNEGSENENSIVIYTMLGGVSWLFTGDIEKDGERDIINTYPNIKVDVLKVGHHGSKTSSTDPFLQTLNPKVGLIPVGKNNRFNHPHPDVIERFNSRKMKIYRTDLQGAIQFRFSKKSGTFLTTIP
ncbi:DNA internalization-related competence protein ComEC/Rec2 [Fredinandcohnia humi]